MRQFNLLPARGRQARVEATAQHNLRLPSSLLKASCYAFLKLSEQANVDALVFPVALQRKQAIREKVQANYKGYC